MKMLVSVLLSLGLLAVSASAEEAHNAARANSRASVSAPAVHAQASVHDAVVRDYAPVRRHDSYGRVMAVSVPVVYGCGRPVLVVSAVAPAVYAESVDLPGVVTGYTPEACLVRVGPTIYPVPLASLTYGWQVGARVWLHGGDGRLLLRVR